MILGSLTDRKHVNDDKLWEMISRANKLTQGDYASWDANCGTLVPLLKRTLVRAKEVKDWQSYFYVMSQTFWYVRRDDVNDIQFAFVLSEMFHQAYKEDLANGTTRFGKEFYVDIAARMVSFYMAYPQISDEKVKQMLEIFLESEQKYGTAWNFGSYEKIMRAALFFGEPELAEKAKKKLEHLDHTNWCYVCYYVRPVLEYCVYLDDYDAVEEMILSVGRKEIPKKYQWCYNMCEQANEETLVLEALQYAMLFGRPEFFRRVFEKWREIFAAPVSGDIGTCEALLHVLAGDLSRLEDTYTVAENDDRKRRENKITPLEAMDWSLWWYFYFRLLAKRGVKEAELDLGDGKKQYPAEELSDYFGKAADEIGAHISKVRKKFDYEKMKEYHEECLREGERVCHRLSGEEKVSGSLE